MSAFSLFVIPAGENFLPKGTTRRLVSSCVLIWIIIDVVTIIRLLNFEVLKVFLQKEWNKIPLMCLAWPFGISGHQYSSIRTLFDIFTCFVQASLVDFFHYRKLFRMPCTIVARSLRWAYLKQLFWHELTLVMSMWSKL